MSQVARLFDKNKEQDSQQYLTFRIGDEIFGMALQHTREVLEYSGVTQVPLMPEFIAGVINLRGDVVPIIDLATRLGRSPIQVKKRTCILIVEIVHDDTEFVLGLLADAVSEVTEIAPEDIENAPSFGAKIRAEFIHGIAKKEDSFVIVLDANKTLSMTELAKLVEAEFE